MSKKEIRIIALYLPQFHPIEENDKWWGKGFTEWTNVSKSVPKFPGHYQPHLPSDMGFYDLRVNETMVEQANLAKQYGISGFCFYHYWFNGKLLLQTPVEQLLKTGNPNFPFCLCWANENWTRRWDGADQEVLMYQNYSLEDDVEHIRYLLPFFKDDRYLKIDNKPVFLVYRSELHPEIKEASRVWREEALKAGLEGIYLIRVENFKQNLDPKEHGFDASMEFAPDINIKLKKYTKKNRAKHFIKKLLHESGIRTSGYLDNRVYSYEELADSMMQKQSKAYKYFRCVCPSWDNSARRKNQATIFLNSTPKKFKEWVFAMAKFTYTNFKEEEQLLFINAWNEWAEGCHLEPDQKYGHSYLRALREGLEEAKKA